jgi:CMP-N-acetylneuraminic acid synthetase
MKYVALICARSGSKGLPGKNIKLLGNTPLIGWAIKIAKKNENISRVIVSTDSEDIAKIALKFGAEVPFMRPKELALDNSPEWLVWRHAVNYLENENKEKFDGLVVLPVTAPLRNQKDVNNCIEEFEKGDVETVITVSEAHRNPYFNMVVNDKDGFSSLVINPNEKHNRRQDAPNIFDMTTVAYVVNTDFVSSFDGIFEGRVRSVNIPKERAIDIDTLYDFKIAEYLISLNT